jgi:protein TonB
MFDTLLESRTVGAQVRSRWAFPIAVLSHVTLVGALIAASLLVTVSLKEPPSRIVLEIVTSAPLPPPLPRGSAAAPAPRRAEQNPPEPETEEMLQPEAIPDQPIQIEEPDSSEPGDGEGVLGGVPGGDPFGVPGGDPNGAPGGAPGGVASPTPKDDPVIVSPGMTPPILKRRVEPEYPELARVIRQEGRVFLQAVISATGRVEEVTVLRSSSPLFEQAAIDAVRQWEYEPARQGDRPVAVYFTIDVRFTLH